MNLSTIGDQNVEVTKSDVDGSYTIEFVKVLGGVPQPLLTSNLVDHDDARSATARHDAVQHVTLTRRHERLVQPRLHVRRPAARARDRPERRSAR